MSMSEWDSNALLSADTAWDDATGAAGAENSAGTVADDLLCLSADPDPRDLKDALIAATGTGHMRIDASAVERLSGPAMQVLLAAMQDALGDGRKLDVLSPSFAFTLSFEAYGLGGSNEPFTVEYT
jgi:STAS domain